MFRRVFELCNQVVLFLEEQHSIGRVEKRWFPHSIGLFGRCFWGAKWTEKEASKIYEDSDPDRKNQGICDQTWFRLEPSEKGQFCVFVRDCVHDNVISKGITEDIADHLTALWDEFQKIFS